MVTDLPMTTALRIKRAQLQSRRLSLSDIVPPQLITIINQGREY